MSQYTIGILGGMGPRATVEFERRLLTALSGTDQLLPQIISVNNGAIPDRSAFIQGIGVDPLAELIKGARLLESAEPNVVCLPCNTAHSPDILGRLMATVPLPVIDMPAACLSYAERQGLQSALILGTAGTQSGQIFDSRTATITCRYPNAKDQTVVSDIIATIKRGLQPTDRQLAQLRHICEKNTADAIILACTELSLLPKTRINNRRIIDSLDILARSCSNLYMEFVAKKGH